MFSRLRTAGVLATTVGVVLVVPGVAQADPLTPRSETFELMCDGETHEVVVSGNGLFTPAHDVNSKTVFVPTMFGDTDITVTIADTGEVIDEFTDPAVSKGSATKERRTSTSCTYTIVFEFHDEELDEHLAITAVGSVEGLLHPRPPLTDDHPACVGRASTTPAGLPGTYGQAAARAALSGAS